VLAEVSTTEMNEGGGALEQRVLVLTIVATGLVEAIETYAPDDVAAALARFEQLAEEGLIARRGDRFELRGIEGSFRVVDAGAEVARFDDLRAAVHDLDERNMATLPSRVRANLALQLRMIRAYEARDLETVEQLLSPTFVQVDHQPAGFEPMDRATFVASIGAFERDGDLFVYAEETLHLDERGNVASIVERETNDAGGVVEWRLITVVTVVEERIARIEYFPVDQLDSALSRYRELTGDNGASSRSRDT
jgi:hypothetical protein